MSRAAQRSGATPTKRLAEDGDICPVCKSSRYLNPNMRFLVNPECYHKMCESCVDRIFSHGPAPCPIAGCQRTLRKTKFRSQTFEDIKVEREVDIRRRVANVFNLREDDFETLKEYNDYLEQVEETTWNLISGIDVDKTEKKMKAFSDANKAGIARNKSAAATEAQFRKAREDAEQEQAKVRRQNAAAEDQLERQQKLEAQRGIIDQLASVDGDATRIVQNGQVVLKKSGVRRTGLDRGRDGNASTTGTDNGDAAGGFSFKGLKKRVAPAPEKAYDPFDGWTTSMDYFVLQDHYEVEWLSKASTDMDHLSGGYNIQDYYARSLCDAFQGFGVFVEEEIAARTSTPAGAAAGARDQGDVNMDDVF